MIKGNHCEAVGDSENTDNREKNIQKGAKPMPRLMPLGAILFFIEIVLSISPLVWAAEKIISKVPDAAGHTAT